MFEKFRQFIDDGKNMLEDAFVIPDDDDFIAVPPGVTEEQLIEEARQYVDAIIAESSHEHHHKNLVGVSMDDVPHNDLVQSTDAGSDDRSDNDDPAGDTTLSPDSNNEQ